MKKWVKITLIAAAVVVALIIAAAIAIPPIAKNYIEKHDRELIGRSIRMDRLRMNIFTGRLRVEGLRIGGFDDSTTFFRLDSFDMRMRLLPLIANRVHVKHITFAGPDVKIYQRGNAFSFDDILAHFASDSTALKSEPEKPSEPWEIGIYDISIRDGHIFYKDLALNATWGLNDLNLHIPGVYFSGEKTDVGAVLNFAEGGSLATQVGYNIATSEFDIGIRLKDLALANTLPYFRQSLDVARVDGRLSADIRLRGNTEHLLALTTDGTASLAGFALHDARQRPVVGLDTLGIRLAEGDLAKMRFQFDRIYVAGLSALFEMTPEGNSFTDLIKSANTPRQTAQAPKPAGETEKAGTDQAQTTGAVSAAPVPTLRIADLEIAGGRVTMRDKTLHRPFEYTVSEIRMRSRDFDPAKRNDLVVDARMQKTGSAKFRWEGTLDDMNNQNITLWLTNLDLRDFGPYCEHFTAYPLTNGNLTFRSQNIIRNRYLDGTNHLDMFEPKVDKKRKDLKAEMNIPLKLGLYVLKDKKGHVKMDLPVKGSLDSPEFSYRKIVLKAIGNVLLKVVTAPFSFLSGNRDNLEYIDIDPQQYAFSSEQYASLDKIAQALQDKPDMHITLTQRINMRRALPSQAANALRMAYAEQLRENASQAGSPDMPGAAAGTGTETGIGTEAGTEVNTAAGTTTDRRGDTGSGAVISGGTSTEAATEATTGTTTGTTADTGTGNSGVAGVAGIAEVAEAGQPARPARRPISMLEYEKIQQMDIRTPAIMAFADSLLTARGISPQGLSADEKAMTLYREKAVQQLASMMAMRNQAIAEYMRTTHAIAEPALRVATMDSTALQSYTGRDRYTIALEVDGETVEVETQPAATSGTENENGAEAETGTDAKAGTETGTMTGTMTGTNGTEGVAVSDNRADTNESEAAGKTGKTE